VRQQLTLYASPGLGVTIHPPTELLLLHTRRVPPRRHARSAVLRKSQRAKSDWRGRVEMGV